MELHLIESYYKWVYSKLHPFLLLNGGSEMVKTYLVTSKELKEALKTLLLRDGLENISEIEISLLIQRCQCTVTILLDNLFHHRRHESITPELTAFYVEVAADLEEILAFLQNDWGRYFNADLNLPLLHWVSEGREMKKKWKGIAKTLSERKENIHLVKILDRCIKGLMYPAKSRAITYGQLSWLKYFFSELTDQFSITAPVYVSLTELLISLKFNECAFISKVYNNIIREAEKRESVELRIEFLRACSKEVDQILEKVHEPLYPAQAPKRMILDWLAKELDYLELLKVAVETKGVFCRTINEAAQIRLFLRLSAQ